MQFNKTYKLYDKSGILFCQYIWKYVLLCHPSTRTFSVHHLPNLWHRFWFLSRAMGWLLEHKANFANHAWASFHSYSYELRWLVRCNRRSSYALLCKHLNTGCAELCILLLCTAVQISESLLHLIFKKKSTTPFLNKKIWTYIITSDNSTFFI